MDFVAFRNRDERRLDDATEDLSRRAIGAAIEVHKVLGPGMPEIAYERALSLELTLQGIRHRTEVPVPIIYKGTLVGEGFIDILVDDRIVLGLKAVENLNPVHRAQILTYLRLTKLQLGLLMNFNVAALKDGLKRVVNSDDSQSC